MRSMCDCVLLHEHLACSLLPAPFLPWGEGWQKPQVVDRMGLCVCVCGPLIRPHNKRSSRSMKDLEKGLTWVRQRETHGRTRRALCTNKVINGFYATPSNFRFHLRFALALCFICTTVRMIADSTPDSRLGRGRGLGRGLGLGIN